MAVGFLGINVLAPVLTDEGRADLAYTLLHQDAMPSWLYAIKNGIAKDPANPGFKHFFLQPHLDLTGKITQVRGSYGSSYGQITSDWSVADETLTYRLTIPANSRSTLKVPTASPATVRDGTTPLAQVAGATFLGYANGIASYRLESGTYHITSTLN